MSFKNWINNNFSQSETINSLIDLTNKKHIIKLAGVFGSTNTLLIATLLNNIQRSILYICKNETEAKNALLDLESYGLKNAYYFPSIETTPYESAIIEESISSQRLEVLKSLLNNEICVVITSIDTVLFNIIVLARGGGLSRAGT